MHSYNRKLNNSDEDSDFGSRYKPPSSYGNSNSLSLSSSRASSSRDPYGRQDNRDLAIRGSRDSFTRDTSLRDSRDNFTTRDTRDSRDNFRREPSFGRDSDKLSESSKYGSYRTSGNKYDNNKNNSDSSDAEPPLSSRYGANSRRTIRHSSESDEDDKFDRRRVTNSRELNGRPMTSSRKDKDGMPDIDSYDGANVFV